MDISQRLLISLYTVIPNQRSPIVPGWEVLSRQGLLLNIVVFCFQTLLQISQGKGKENGGCLLSAGSSTAVMSARRRLNTFFLYSLVVSVKQPGLYANNSSGTFCLTVS